MPFTDEQIINISDFIKQCSYICMHPNKKNDITIKNNTISLILGGNIILSNKIDVFNLKKQIDSITYGENVFLNNNSKFSPLEADRNKYSYVWKKIYKKINFPPFMPIVLLILLYTGTIPSVLDLCKIYRIVYIEKIPLNETLTFDERLSYYKNSINNKKDHDRLGKFTYLENQSIENVLIRFKQEYNPETFHLPFNEFSVEHLYNRIYKAYGPIIRDVFNAFNISSFPVHAYYSLYNDLSGVDLFINEIPIFVFTNTSSAKDFHMDKITIKHPKLKDKFGIKLIKDFKNQKSGVHLINDDAINQVINIIKNKPIDKPLDKFYNVYF